MYLSFIKIKTVSPLFGPTALVISITLFLIKDSIKLIVRVAYHFNFTT